MQKKKDNLSFFLTLNNMFKKIITALYILCYIKYQAYKDIYNNIFIFLCLQFPTFVKEKKDNF